MDKELKNTKVYLSLVIIFSLFMLFLAVFGDHGLVELRKLNKKQTSILSNIDSVKNENVRLYMEIEKLKTSRRYIEEMARKEYGMVKDGEIVFLFQD